MPEPAALVRSLFAAFNRRDAEAVADLCDEEVEFYPVGTRRVVGREDPYRGAAGLREYLDDVGAAWEELVVTPTEVAADGETLLVWGRVYQRNRDLGISDLPIAWVWQLREGRFRRGEAFPDPELASERFDELRPGS